MPSPNRKAVKTYLTSEEYEQITAMAEQAGVSVSTFIKRVCLGQEVRSKTDHQALLTLLKANADLGRLGGLFKMALSEGTAGQMAFEFRTTLHKIERSQAEMEKVCRIVAGSIGKKRQ